MNTQLRLPRPKRLGLTNKNRELAAMKECRAAMVRIETKYKFGSPEYVTAGEVMDKLDALAELFTGDRKALWNT